MALKPFPEDGKEEISYEELIKPFREIIETAYSLKEKKVTKDIPYDGYGFTHRIAACNPQPPDRFTLDGIEYDKERDRDILDVVFNVIFQLGYEQGAFIQRKEWSYYKKQFEQMMDEQRRANPRTITEADKKRLSKKLQGVLEQTPKPKKKTKKKKS